MKKTEYIKAIKEYNKKMAGIDNKNYVLSLAPLNQEENTSIEKMDDTILKLMRHGKKLANAQFQVNLDDFRKYVADLEFDVNDVCELGGIAHKLILCGIPLKMDCRIRTGMNFTEDTLKELAISEFLKKGLNPNLKDEMGYTFIEAAIFGRPDCNSMNFSDKIQQLSEKDYQTFEHSIIPAEKSNHYFIINLINEAKKYGFDVNTKDKSGNSLVHTAIGSPYFNGNIVNLIETLGEDFDINVRNDKGQDIIEFLDYCIENEQAYSEYSNKAIVNAYKKELISQRKEIEEFIMLNRNSSITSPEIKANFSKKLNYLKKQIEINTRMATFLGEPYNKVPYDISTITINELNSLIQQELKNTDYFVWRTSSVTKENFGKLYKVVCKFVMLGQEEVILGKNRNRIDIKISIEEIGSIFNSKNSYPYPYRGTIIEKIKWLHDVIVANEERKREIEAKVKAKRQRN